MQQKESIPNIPPAFAELILPVPIPKLFTYQIPDKLRPIIKIGQRAIIPFGSKKILTGIVSQLHTDVLPQEYEIKSILELIDEDIAIHAQQFDVYQWISSYYMCSLGDVMQAALPSGLRLSSESRVQVHPSFKLEKNSFSFSEKERIILQKVTSSPASYTEIAKLLGTKNIYGILKSLSSKKAIILFEHMREKYKPKTEKRIRLASTFTSHETLKDLFETLKNKPKQEAIVLKYLQHIPLSAPSEQCVKGIAQTVLMEDGFSPSALRSLSRKKIIEEFKTIVPRYKSDLSDTPVAPVLNEKQVLARNRILHYFKEKKAVLLHGVTGSGKTEIYIDLINQILERGQQALLLVPEIALTTQMVVRLKKAVAARVGVFHSKFSDNERVEIWNGVLSKEFPFIVGARSALFLPFDNLGLIIVDEEHDSSYKQQAPAPRYHARDVALMMGTLYQAKVVLGSATPSSESYFQAMENKYGLVTLTERYGTANLPNVLLADMTLERRRKTNRGKFSALLLSEIKKTLQNQGQVLIFQNRRGYAPMIQCEDCAWIPQCVQCSVSLTYHQAHHNMICHYCGYRRGFPSRCPTCSSKRILTKGYGTEKLEEELKLLFPEAHVQRMDRDTTRARNSYESIIENFEKSRTQILVGTQMITKGLDFENVVLSGVFDADRMMHFPDFRSHEKTFQLITQVSGRSGRRDKKGKVVIQTANPSDEIFQYILHHDTEGFIKNQLHDRQAHFYPPYSRLIEITVKHTDKLRCKEAATHLEQRISSRIKGITVLGPGEPVVSKIKNEFMMTLLIKRARGKEKLHETKLSLQQTADRLLLMKEYRSVQILFNVDPL